MSAETVDVSVHLKATRTVVHDLVLRIRIPVGAIGQHAIRSHLEALQPGILSAACTDDTVDRVTDVAVLDVLDVVAGPRAHLEGDRDAG